MKKEPAAIGIVETSSIAKGIEVADSMMKAASVKMVVSRTICPGKYMVLVGGSVDSVSASVEAGVSTGAHTVVDSMLIAHIHPDVFPAINGVAHVPEMKALGVVESFSVAACIEAADAALKCADVQLVSIHLAMAIGGKAYLSLTGDVAAVTAAVEAAANLIGKKGLLVDSAVIPSPDPSVVREFI